MMVYGRHSKNAPTRHAKRNDLNDDAGSFEHEKPAHNQKHNLVTNDDGKQSKRRAQGERADVAREHAR